MASNTTAQMAAKQASGVRARYGVDVTVRGKPYRMMTKPLKVAPEDLTMEGAQNAAATDLRIFNASPRDFPAPLAAGSLLRWDNQYYTVLLSTYSEMSGIPISLKISAYRSPQATQSTAETTAEATAEGKPANAGLRKEYLPPKPPF